MDNQDIKDIKDIKDGKDEGTREGASPCRPLSAWLSCSPGCPFSYSPEPFVRQIRYGSNGGEMMRGSVCNIGKFFVLAALVCLSGCILDSTSAWVGTGDAITRSYEVGSGGLLTVEADLGSIEVRTGSANRVDIEIDRSVNSRNRERAAELARDIEITTSQSGNDVLVRARVPGRGWWNGSRNVKLDFHITVPRVYNVDLKTSGGGITVDDLQGEVKSRTSGGALRFGQIQGPVYGRTSGGGIRLTGCVGDADVGTSGGGIEIGEVEGQVVATTSGGPIKISRARGRVRAETSGGGIHVDEVLGSIQAATSGGGISARITIQPTEECRLETSGGSLKIELAEEIGVDLDAKTSGGRVRVDFPVSQFDREKQRVRGEINGGGPALILRTSGGGIEVRKIGRVRAEQSE
jgi:DUF4097 and DUF4098 domain-containing protein YvlB